jgi:hypothetical protein
VIHPYHPQRGRKYELIDRRRTWGEDRVYFHDERGELKRLPAAWTSAGTVDPFVSQSAGRAHFRIEDLLELATLITRQLEVRGPSRRGATKARPSRK